MDDGSTTLDEGQSLNSDPVDVFVPENIRNGVTSNRFFEAPRMFSDRSRRHHKRYHRRFIRREVQQQLRASI